MENVQGKLGCVDILINNAGIQHMALTQDYPTDKFNDIMKINFDIQFFLCKYALPDMYKKNWGRIVNIASVHGFLQFIIIYNYQD